MPIRLLKPYDGQAVGTLYWAARSVEDQLRALSIADDQIERATDYALATRIVTTATANVSTTARTYRMISATAQTLALGQLQGWPNGTVLTVIQEGAGKTTITPGTGVTVNTALSTLITSGQWAVATLIKTGDTTWVAYGGLGG